MVTRPRASADPYEIVLNDLRAQRSKIDHAISAIENLRGVKDVSADSADEVESGPFSGMPIHEAATALLMERGVPLSNAEIAAAVQERGLAMKSADPVNTVGAVLTRRSMLDRDIVKAGRGIWGLKVWVNRAPKDNERDSDVAPVEQPAARGVLPGQLWSSAGRPWGPPAA